VHLKICKLGEPIPVSDLLPMMENFGLRVISEHPYELEWDSRRSRLHPGFRVRAAWRCIGGDRSRRAALRGSIPRSLARRGR
jgi:hypothetical protein